MELVKIHGEAEEESKEGVQVASESYSRTFSSSATSDMMESNTGEHSSESDFEQGENGEDILVQAAAVAERNIMGKFRLHKRLTTYFNCDQNTANPY